MLVKIGELNFELLTSAEEEEEEKILLEIENDASMVYESVDVPKAIQLRNLLDEFIHQASKGS
ncbi:hypothetical protein [Peredibacter starrii]|uniref:Uncharacterized protein n=1 Tax=Peredibacter starrii TaxID=28202 RepID=A0AAX4HU93_9BACT|nr:hypothetical protein [Peredibacter starrii]WPU66758.1 hypothetical protein SOO65_08360 [Peredibacter starrii]